MAAQIIGTRARLIHAPNAPVLGAGASGRNPKLEAELQKERDERLHGFSMEENEQRSLLATERDSVIEKMRSLTGGSGSSNLDLARELMRYAYGQKSAGSAPRGGVQVGMTPATTLTFPAITNGVEDAIAALGSSQQEKVANDDLSKLAASIGGRGVTNDPSQLDEQFGGVLSNAFKVAAMRRNGMTPSEVDIQGIVSKDQTAAPSADQSDVSVTIPQSMATANRRPSYWGGDWDYGSASDVVVNSFAGVGNMIDDLINLKTAIA